MSNPTLHIARGAYNTSTLIPNKFWNIRCQTGRKNSKITFWFFKTYTVGTYLKGRNFRGKKISRISRIFAKFAKINSFLTPENVDLRKLIPAKFSKIGDSQKSIPAKFFKIGDSILVSIFWYFRKKWSVFGQYFGKKWSV